MQTNYKRALEKTLSFEGGWSDHKKDPGGATMKGVTIAVFASFKGRSVTKEELRNISDEDLASVYKQYWYAPRCDVLKNGVDAAVFDASVNSGQQRAARWLQGAVGVKQDGTVGRATLAAADRASAVETIKKVCAARFGFLRGLKIWGTFGKGWSRRVAEIEAFCVALAYEGTSTKFSSSEHSRSASNATKRDAANATVTGVGGTTGVGGIDVLNLPTWVSATIVVVVAAVFVFYLSRTMHNSNRAKAYAKLGMEN